MRSLPNALAVAALASSLLALACSSSPGPAVTPSPPGAPDAASAALSPEAPRNESGATISGVVRDDAGRPLPGVTVAAFSLDGTLFEDLPDDHQRVDEQGAFSLRVPRGHEYAVTATHESLSPAYMTTDGFRNETALDDVTLTLGTEPAVKLRGKVSLHDGNVAASAVVRAYPGDRKLYEIYVAQADDAGRYELALAKRKFMLIGSAVHATPVIERIDFRTPVEPVQDIRLRPPPAGIPTDVESELSRLAVPVAMEPRFANQQAGDRIDELLCNARVVAIGESTHGSSEFARLRGQVLFHLKQSCGTSVLLLESDTSIAADIDDYVLTGVGDPAKSLVENGSWPFAHQEAVELIQAIREYNRTAKQPIRVLGFDPYFARLPATRLLEYVKSRSKKTHKRLSKQLSVFTRTDFHQYYRGASDEERAEARKGLAAAKQFLAKGNERGPGAAQWRRARLHLQALNAVEEMYSADLADYGVARDRALATTTRWLLDEYVPGGKAVMWAHNGHVVLARPVWKTDTMGDLLQDDFGDGYVAIGTYFGRGSFYAIGMVDGKTDKFSKFELGPPSADSLESVLAKAGGPAYLLDISRVSAATRAWLDSELKHRSTGSLHTVGSDAEQTGAPGLSFHMLAFIDEITAIEPLDGIM